MEMWTIGCVSSLGLEILFWWSDHGEAAFGLPVVEQGIDRYLCWHKAVIFSRIGRDFDRCLVDVDDGDDSKR